MGHSNPSQLRSQAFGSERRLPQLASRLNRVTVVRSMTHPVPIHNVGNTVTGIARTDVPMELNQRDPRHWPFFGSALDYMETTRGETAASLIPRNVIVPWRQSANAPDKRAGFFGGFLGARYDPTAIEFQGRGTSATSLQANNPYCGISLGSPFNFPATSLMPEITLDRFRGRAACSISSAISNGNCPACPLGGAMTNCNRSPWVCVTPRPCRAHCVWTASQPRCANDMADIYSASRRCWPEDSSKRERVSSRFCGTNSKRTILPGIRTTT